NPGLAINSVREIYGSDALVLDEIDGISLEFSNWRFNLRSSNTEPVVRLNVESRSDVELMKNKTDEILNLLKYI
ncbi:TPA: phosphomannomutase CpsG, partial [Escherichia coli]